MPQDLGSFLENLSDVPDPYEGQVPPAEEAAEAPPPRERTRLDDLCDHIRAASKRAELAGAKTLAAPPLSLTEEEAASLLPLLGAGEAGDIAWIQGQRDTYYYCQSTMTDNYAHIVSLVDDKDLTRTVAEMVRFNCKTYPSPTPIVAFTKHPYYATKTELERVRDRLGSREPYLDIGELTTTNGKVYLFSTQTMSARYAKALAEDAEHGEFD